MDFNKLTYYRANPFVNNDFIPLASMQNRSKKQFISQIPKGQQHISSKPGKRIFKQRVSVDEIQKDKILQSPEKYPYQNKIALNKNFSRNLDTIDIEGASSGTLVSQSVKNKHKALEELRKRNLSINNEIGKSLDQKYAQQRRQLAEQFMKKNQNKLKYQNQQTNKNNIHPSQQNQSKKLTQNHKQTKLNPHLNKNFVQQYQRYIGLNSNQKYNSIVSSQFDYQRFQRYKINQNNTQTIQQGIFQGIPSQRKSHSQQSNYNSVDKIQEQSYYNNLNQKLNKYQNNPPKLNIQSRSNSYFSNKMININNRYKNNPEYIEQFPNQLNKRLEQKQKNQQIQQSLRKKYENNRTQFRRINPTNLSFNIAARNALISSII